MGWMKHGAKAACLLVAVCGLAVPPDAMADAGLQLQNDWESYGYEESSKAVTAEVPRLFEGIEMPEELGEAEARTPAQDANADDMESLEQRIDLLRGQIQDTKSMILNLGENISEGFVTSTKLLIVHENELDNAFEIESVEYKLDGFTIYSSDSREKMSATPELVVYDSSVLPGNHTLDVVYNLRGGGYGVFTYMNEYRFDLRNQYYFSAPKGKAVELVVRAVDQGGDRKMQDRPALRFAIR